MAEVRFTGTGETLDNDRDVDILGLVSTVNGNPPVEVGSALDLDLVPATPAVTKGPFSPFVPLSLSQCVGVETPNFVPVGPMPVPNPAGVVLNGSRRDIIL